MAITLQLKLRKSASPQLNARVLLAFLAGPLSDEEKVAQLRERLDTKAVVHDKAWLAHLVNWSPEGGMALTEQAPWLKLAVRVSALDEEREGPFTLSAAQAELLWKRMNDPKFKLGGLESAWAEFVLDFCKAAGKSFGGDVDPEEVESV